MGLTFAENVFKDSKLSKLTLRNRISVLNSIGLTKENYAKVLANIMNVDQPDKSINSRVTYMFHVISMLKALPESDINKKLIEKYASYVDKLKKIQLAKNKSNTTTQKDDFIPLDSLQSQLNSKEPDFNEFIANPRTKDDTVRFYKA